MNNAKNKKVLMALSGGVDSAACVRILQQSGYEVEGLVISFSPAHTTALAAAQTAAGELGIQLHTAYCEALFDEKVVLPFCNDYAQGRTPNPCVVCNPHVKFKTLVDEADRLSIPYIATGHYARVAKHGDFFYITAAASTARDQSYMLYRLPQSILSRLVLPAGELEKEEIRSTAQKAGLTSANAPDSQEICFIPDGNYPDYILSRGISSAGGSFIAPDGESLGAHKGILHYTVGQRRGLGVALGKPVFVKSISAKGDVSLAFNDDLFAKSISLEDTLFTCGKTPENGKELYVKIRSMAKPVPCRLYFENNSTEIHFSEPQRAPAPGQHAVLYEDGRVVGGGIINGAAFITKED